MRGSTGEPTGAIARAEATMKVSALVLAVALVFNSTCSALQTLEPTENVTVQTPEQKEAARAKAEVTRRGVGTKSRVRVKLRDKHELKGHITQIGEDSFQLQLEPGWLDSQDTKDELISIRYAEVEKIRGPRSLAASIGIGVGLTVAAIALLAALAVLEWQKHKHCNYFC